MASSGSCKILGAFMVMVFFHQLFLGAGVGGTGGKVFVAFGFVDFDLGI